MQYFKKNGFVVFFIHPSANQHISYTEPSSGDVKQEAADVDTAPLVGSDIGDAKHEAADVDTALHVGSDITLQLNKTEESHGIILHHWSSIW